MRLFLTGLKYLVGLFVSALLASMVQGALDGARGSGGGPIIFVLLTLAIFAIGLLIEIVSRLARPAKPQ